MTVHYNPGAVAMVTALNRPEPYRASYDGKTWRELVGGAFCVDAPTSIHPLVVLDLPRGARAGWDVLIDALRDAQDKTGYRMTFGDIIDQIQAQVSPPKPYRGHEGSMPPWPLVSECHSAHRDDHECPQCSWEHDHDWVAWLVPEEFRSKAGCPGVGVPVRCSKCGARKCDQDDCAERRHTHTHADEAVPA